MFITDQSINFYDMRSISDAFDIAETDVNYDFRFPSDTPNFLKMSRDLFYSFCGA